MGDDGDRALRLPRHDGLDRGPEPNQRLVNRFVSEDSLTRPLEERSHGALELLPFEPRNAGSVVLVQIRDRFDRDAERPPDERSGFERLGFPAGREKGRLVWLECRREVPTEDVSLGGEAPAVHIRPGKWLWK
jgi:hypothetical protein